MSPAEKALARALGEWQARVRDPARGDASPDAERCRARILTYIREGLAVDRKAYLGDGDAAFCGAFASWCWLAGGLDLAKASADAPADAPGVPLGSTYRLHAAARRRPGLAVKNFGDIAPGNVVTVDTGGGRDYGDHITLALAWDRPKSELVIVHGNGHGRLPSGEWVEGVVISTVPRAAIRAAYDVSCWVKE